MRIPYGKSNFAALRTGRYFYADKTPFLPILESHEAGYGHLLFLRPRRMGKSLFVSMLEHYYDVGRTAQFDDLFGGLWIHEHPTEERNAYLVLTLDFSTVSTDGGAEDTRRSFTWAVRNSLLTFVLRYRERVPELGRLDAGGAGAAGAARGDVDGGEDHEPPRGAVRLAKHARARAARLAVLLHGDADLRSARAWARRPRAGDPQPRDARAPVGVPRPLGEGHRAGLDGHARRSRPWPAKKRLSRKKAPR